MVPRASIRQALFARFWGVAAGPINRTLAVTKRQLFADLPGHIVEIGPGIGSNFEYYPAGTTVHAFETNPDMHPKLQAAAEEHELHLEAVALDLRNAALPADSYDAVVSTLVLCSVDDPTGLVGDVRRILRPGGRFLFLEHVAPQPGTAARTIAKVVQRPWAWLGDSCNVMAQTHEVVGQAGFAKLDAQVEAFGGRLDPSSDHYWGVAVK